jgi:hypothetical protein
MVARVSGGPHDLETGSFSTPVKPPRPANMSAAFIGPPGVAVLRMSFGSPE